MSGERNAAVDALVGSVRSCDPYARALIALKSSGDRRTAAAAARAKEYLNRSHEEAMRLALDAGYTIPEQPKE